MSVVADRDALKLKLRSILHACPEEPEQHPSASRAATDYVDVYGPQVRADLSHRAVFHAISRCSFVGMLFEVLLRRSQARASANYKKDNVRLQDAQSLLTWIHADSNPPSWIFVKV